MKKRNTSKKSVSKKLTKNYCRNNPGLDCPYLIIDSEDNRQCNGLCHIQPCVCAICMQRIMTTKS